jgi:hypothetical protein
MPANETRFVYVDGQAVAANGQEYELLKRLVVTNKATSERDLVAMWDANHAALNWLVDNQPQFHAILLETFERRRKQLRKTND